VNNAELVSEKRLVNRLKNYWDLLRGSESIPEYVKFNKAAIADMWTNCIVVSVSNAGKQKVYKYEHVGNSAAEAFGKNLTGVYASSYEKSLMPGSNLMTYLDKSVDERSFLISQGQFVNLENKIVKFRDCMLPFIDLNGNITYVLIGLSWRSF
jgi:hypothetical protein